MLGFNFSFNISFSDNFSATEVPAPLQNGVPHQDEDPVVPRTYPEYESSQPTVPMVRKVAAGPPVPRYKGMSIISM